MAKSVKPLFDINLRKIKSSESIQKLCDGGGLYFICLPQGTKFFRFDYSFQGKRKSISFGTYPDVSLNEARQKRNEAKQLLKDNICPSENKKIQKISNDKSLNTIVNFWIENIAKSRWSEKTYLRSKSNLENNFLKFLGSKNINDITRVDVLDCLKRLQDRDISETSRKLLNYIDRIFKYAVSYNLVEHNIIADIDRKYSFKKITVIHFPTLINENEISVLLYDIDSYIKFNSDISTVYILKILPYVFTRPGELRNAEWIEFDFDKKIWEIPASKMKMRKAHIVPLSHQVVKLLLEIKQYSFNSKYVFPSPISNLKVLSENTINNALARLGYKNKMVAHGFRAMASTILHEKISEHGFYSDIIEVQLSHAETNQIKAAYNRENKLKYIDERFGLMQWWADYLDFLRAKQK